MNRPLKRKRTLVTCGSWCIGAAIVHRLAHECAGVALSYRPIAAMHRRAIMQAALLVPVWVFAAALRLPGRRLGDTALPIDSRLKQLGPKWSKAEMRIVVTLPPDEALEQLPRRSASAIQTLRSRLRQEAVKLKAGDPVLFADDFQLRTLS